MSGTAAVTSAGTQLLETGSIDPKQVLVDSAIAGGTFFAGTGLAKAMSGGGCFVAGTVVLTSLGLKNIEAIENGDYVLSENPETGEQEYKMVVDTYIHEKTTIVEVDVNGETIQTTVEHPFWVESKKWVEASRLKPGDIIRLSNGNHAVIENINIVQLDKPILVYNFEVVDYHTYYVSDAGVLVHNTCNAGGVADDLKPQNGTTDTTDLYRAMSIDEFDDVMQNTSFSPYEKAMETKWFTTNADDAAQWGNSFYPEGNFKIAEVTVSTESLNSMYYVEKLDNIGPAYNAERELVNKAIQKVSEVIP